MGTSWPHQPHEQSVLNEDQIQPRLAWPWECELPGLTLIMPMGSIFTALIFGSSWTCVKFYLLKCCNKLSIVLTLEVFFHSPFNFVPTESASLTSHRPLPWLQQNLKFFHKVCPWIALLFPKRLFGILAHYLIITDEPISRYSHARLTVFIRWAESEHRA